MWAAVAGDIDVDAPYLEVYAFSPAKQDVKYAEYLGSRWDLCWCPLHGKATAHNSHNLEKLNETQHCTSSKQRQEIEVASSCNNWVQSCGTVVWHLLSLPPSLPPPRDCTNHGILLYVAGAGRKSGLGRRKGQIWWSWREWWFLCQSCTLLLSHCSYTTGIKTRLQ